MLKTKSLVLAVLLVAGLSLIIYTIAQKRDNLDDKAQEPGAPVNISAPEIEVTDAATGRKILSANLKGKVLFINFWASWCQSCKEEMPSIENLLKRFLDNQDLVIITILFRDDPQNGISYMKQNGFNFPVMVDADGKAARAYGLTGVPETYIIDKKGILREKVIGPAPWDSPEALAIITKLLKE